MLTQKEVVFNAVKSIVGSEFQEGMDCGAWFKQRPDAKKQLHSAVMEAFANGECELKNAQKDLGVYVTGLINNHLRKDTRINGGEKYVPANPGSRAGQGDPQIKEARKLLKTLAEGTPEHAKVLNFINTRIAEIKAEKNKVEINVDMLPAELQGLIG